MNAFSTPSAGEPRVSSSHELLLFQSGLFFRILHPLRFADRRKDMLLRKIAPLSLLAWLPLLILSALEGRLHSGSPGVPFIMDLEVHFRFLLSLPLLLVAEIVAQRRVRALPQQFIERSIIPESAFAKFESAIDSAHRLRSSLLATILLLLFVYGVGILIVWRQYIAINVETWYATPTIDGAKLSNAGLWYGLVSLPIFQYVLCRWYFRLFVWARFLWQVSRLRLDLIPTHPDRLAGLSFLQRTTNAFTVLSAAHGALLAGYLSTRVILLGEPLTQFTIEIGLLVSFVLFVIVSPLIVFRKRLVRARRRGLRDYGVLAENYVRDFHHKWLGVGQPQSDPLMGSADIQSLADLGSAYGMVKSMRTIPVSKEMLLQLSVAALIPVLPLLLTIMSVEELGKKLISILLK